MERYFRGMVKSFTSLKVLTHIFFPLPSLPPPSPLHSDISGLISFPSSICSPQFSVVPSKLRVGVGDRKYKRYQLFLQYSLSPRRISKSKWDKTCLLSLPVFIQVQDSQHKMTQSLASIIQILGYTTHTNPNNNHCLTTIENIQYQDSQIEK